MGAFIILYLSVCKAVTGAFSKAHPTRSGTPPFLRQDEEGALTLS